ncbi:MAG: MoxR family ATPase [Bacteroidales bacterium]|nr:MoxR family ATPase [Bacteroidales bacterium]
MENFTNMPDDGMQEELTRISKAVNDIRAEISKVLIGQYEMVDLLLAALFSGGHVLLEGVPGIAKTLTARLLSKTLSIGFTRIQFTPDLMPADIIGTTVFNMKTSEFTFNKGPVFSNLILIDEINRSPAKTQAALFEVMEEKQISVDGTTYDMEFPFMVVATQNPIEQEGTYKLPEAQLDRFLFKVNLKYPSMEEEVEILNRFKNDFENITEFSVNKVLDDQTIRHCRAITEQIIINDPLIHYIANIIDATRNNADLYLGASPRASLAIMKASKAIAAINGRSFVTPDDIRYVAGPVLNHRLILAPEKELEGAFTEDVIDDILKNIEVPR